MSEPTERECLAFIRERLRLAARIWRWEPYDGPRCHGISSDALALYGIGGQRPVESQYPSDGSDLAACEETYALAPAAIQERMAPVLEEYRRHLRERVA